MDEQTILALVDVFKLLAVTTLSYFLLALVRSGFRKAAQPTKTWLACMLDSLLEVPYRMKLGRFGRPTDITSALQRALKSTRLTNLCLDEDGNGSGIREDLSFVQRYARTRELGLATLGIEYSPLGYIATQTVMQRRMEVRLRFIDYLRRHPDIAAAKPSLAGGDPIFVIGFPRTGTTFLHELLGLHPGVRMHYSWEQINPVPNVEVPAGTSKESRIKLMRIDRQQRYRKERLYFSTLTTLLGEAIQKIHRIGYDDPEECTTPCSMELPWAVTELPLHVAASQVINDGAGQAFRYYRRYLQLLEWQNPRAEVISREQKPEQDQDQNLDHEGKKWMLKCPFHPPYLDSLIEEFPECTIVWTHRDPVECIASACSLYETLASVAIETHSLDRKALGRAVLDYTEVSLNRARMCLDKISKSNKVKIMHIRYADNIKDPVLISSQVLTKSGIKCEGREGGEKQTAEWSRRIQVYLAKNTAERQRQAKTKEKLHDYSLEDYGLSEKQVRERFKTYTDKYNLA